MKFRQTIKLRVCYESTEIEQKASKMSIVFVKILFHFETCTRNIDEKSKWIEQETRLKSGNRK